jgi:hypothetical protein
MTDEMIKTDRVITQSQADTLAALLSHIIPASQDGRMPAATDIEFESYVASIEPNFAAELPSALDYLAFVAGSKMRFEALTDAAQQAAIEQSQQKLNKFYSILTPIVFACYYQNEKVLEGLGLESRAPFPKGNDVELGDLSLLDPVRTRGLIWRQSDEG